jgi:hypothetical protein
VKPRPNNENQYRVVPFLFHKKIKNPQQGGSNLQPAGLQGGAFTTRILKVLCLYDTCLFI